MTENSLEELLPEINTEISSDTSEEVAGDEPVVEETPAVEENAAPAIEIKQEVNTEIEMPSAEAIVLHSIKGEGELFLNWILNSAIDFLNLANLSSVQTVNSLRGISEQKIRDKIQMANSILVLIANYGSQMNNAPLVKACEVYAEKMRVIIKRVGL